MTRRRKMAWSAGAVVILTLAAVGVWSVPGSGWVRFSSSVTVCELDPALPKAEPSAEAFPIPPYKMWTPIRRLRRVSGAEAARIVRAFRSATTADGGQALCHEPAYGLVFQLGPIETFRTSVCFECNNYYDRVRSEYGWRGFSEHAPELFDALNDILPVKEASPP
jgi:hypothetical protein